MLVGVNGVAMAGEVKAVTTSGTGLPPEYWAERLMQRLVKIEDTAPEPLKAQCAAFRDEMHRACLHYMRNMAKSARTTLLNELRLTGNK